MFFRTPEAHTRSVVKAVSWRLLGSVDTFILTYIFTQKLSFAVSISGTEVITKIALYYFHERLWTLIPWGRAKTPPLLARSDALAEGQPA